MPEKQISIELDSVDRSIIEATQKGLSVSRQPYHDVAKKLGLKPKDVITRMQRMHDSGVIRRIGAVPNHYALGYKANGMTVWDVPDEKIDEFGNLIGQLNFVSHCYHRPRHLPDWPYNLFAMVHGQDREATKEKIEQIAKILGDNDRGHDVLYSTRILKKTGLRLSS